MVKENKYEKNEIEQAPLITEMRNANSKDPGQTQKLKYPDFRRQTSVRQHKPKELKKKKNPTEQNKNIN